MKRRPIAVVVRMHDDRAADAAELAARLEASGYEVHVERRSVAYRAGHVIGVAFVAAVIAVALLGLISMAGAALGVFA